MSMFEKKPRYSHIALLIGVCILAAALTACVHRSNPHSKTELPPMATAPHTAAPSATVQPETQPAETLPPQTPSSGASGTATESTEVPSLGFPQIMEDGKLSIAAPFPYDGLNPDNHNSEGKNICSITVENLSRQHLLYADILFVLTDGTEIPFRLEHLPAGKRVTAFAADDSPIPADAEWAQIRIDAEFTDHSSLREQGLHISENGTLLELTNDTGAALARVTLYCHNLLGDEYFGGKAYPYEVNNIPADGTVTVDAAECILGIAEVAFADGIQE